MWYGWDMNGTSKGHQWNANRVRKGHPFSIKRTSTDASGMSMEYQQSINGTRVGCE